MKARLPKEYQGGSQNMNAMLKQAQKMQDLMAERQQELNEREFTATAGGGAVEVAMTGSRELKKISLKPEVVDPDDIEMLEDLVVAAVNEVLRTVETTTSEEMDKITGGLQFPGM